MRGLPVGDLAQFAFILDIILDHLGLRTTDENELVLRNFHEPVQMRFVAVEALAQAQLQLGRDRRRADLFGLGHAVSLWYGDVLHVYALFGLLLIAFLHDLQAPGQFVALETANLKIDATDPTQLRGRFKIARWYAPQ